MKAKIDTIEIRKQVPILADKGMTIIEIAKELNTSASIIRYHYLTHLRKAPKCKRCEMFLSSKFHQAYPCDQDFMVF